MEKEGFLFNDSKIFKLLSNRNSHYETKIKETYDVTVDILNRISNTFPNYTLHDIKHSFNVLRHMYDLIGPKIEEFSDIELSAMIYAALLHDIGMFVDDEEKQSIITGKKDTDTLKFRAVLNTLNNNENEAIQQFIRPMHGERSKKYIEENLRNYITIPETPNISYADHLGKICLSHEMSISWIKSDLDDKAKIGREECNCQFIAIVLRLADLLDFDGLRAPISLYNKLKLGNYSKEEWRKHFILTNTKKAYYDESHLNIIFDGNCDDPSTYRKLLDYTKQVESELRDSFELINLFTEPKYKLPLQTIVNNKVKTIGFTTSDLSMTVDFKAITKLLMGKNLYGDSKAALREILQNSIDACYVMDEEHNDDDLNKYSPVIQLEISDDDKVIIKDNGTGMTREILRKYFLSVGNSYYNSDEYKFKGLKYNPISKYGIGFLSAFMLSDDIAVTSKHYSENCGNKIEVTTDSEFVVWKDAVINMQHGTQICLGYKKFSESFAAINDIVNYIKDTFSLTNITFKVKDKSGECIELNFNKVFENTIITPSYRFYFNNNSQRQINSLISPLSNKDIYYYNSSVKSVEKYSEQINYLKCIDNQKIAVLTLDIIDDDTADKINDFYDVCEDEDEAIERFEDYFDDVVILLTSNQYEELNNKKSDRFSNKDQIFDGYSYKDFCDQFGHAYDSTSFSIHVHNVIVSDDNNLILYKYKPKSIEAAVYCRGVYINNYKIDLREGIYLDVPKEVSVDIRDDNIYPNISRDKINQDVLNSIRLTLEKQLLEWNIKKVKDNNIKLLLEYYISSIHNPKK